MIDTHTHLYRSSYGEGFAEAIERAKAAGITSLILPNVDEESISDIEKTKQMFPEIVHVAMGLHPTDVKENWSSLLDKMEKLLKNGEYVAVGEVGIDLYWDKSNLKNQQAAFRRQLEIAERLNLPVIIHSREALEETLEVIDEVKPSVTLVFHSFTGGPADVARIREKIDPYFGINGVVTYKNAEGLRDSLPVIGIDRIILETDSPYLSPVPHRGKKNESAYISHVVEKVSEVIELPPDRVEKITDSNARKIFGL